MSIKNRIGRIFGKGGGNGSRFPEGEDWERKTIQQLAYAGLQEQRRARRWGLFFKLFFVGYLILLLVMGLPKQAEPVSGNYTAIVDLNGMIAQGRMASADNLIPALRDAFDSKAKAVILRANSPGGATVQSAYVYDEIMRLKKLHKNKKIYAVVTDLCASGCYYIISATDKIYANPSSLVGSIGVIMDAGFGFTDIMKKFGVERRVFTAGEHKDMLDPFSPLNPSDKKFVEDMLQKVHRQFIDAVKKGRGGVLKDDGTLFTGRFWEGETAKKLGLVDDFGSASYVAREVVGARKLVDFTRRQHWLDRLASSIGASMGNAIATHLGKNGLQSTY